MLIFAIKSDFLNLRNGILIATTPKHLLKITTINIGNDNYFCLNAHIPRFSPIVCPPFRLLRRFQGLIPVYNENPTTLLYRF